MRCQETLEITKVLEDYIRGTRQGDAELLRRIIHPDAMIAGWFGNDLLVRRPNGFIARVAESDAGEGYQACVASISVLGKTAVGVVQEDGLWDDQSFINQFHLIRNEEDRWVITAKLFHRD